LALRAGSNSVQGQIAAKLDTAAPAPAKGTIAAMSGTALPSLDGRFSIAVPDWTMLKEISGISMSGAALKSELVLTNNGRQAVELWADMPSFNLDASGRQIDLAGLRLDMKAADLWGRPSAEISAGFKELKADRIVQGETSFVAEGGLDAVRFALESTGGVESRVRAEWKPGSVYVEELKAKFLPESLGLPKGPEAGICLTAPVTASYSGDAVTLSPFSAAILPGGQLSLEGRFSPSVLKGQLELNGVDLKNYRHFVPSLPAGLLAMQADFSGSPQKPAGNFKLDLKDVSMPGSGLKPVDAELIGNIGKNGRSRMLQASLELPEKSLKALSLDRFKFKAAVPFMSPASGMAMPDMKAPFNAEFSLGGQVAGLWKLVPAADLKLSGMLDAESRIGGTLSAPVVTAHVALDKGRFFDVLNGVGLNRIQLKIDAEQFDVMNRKAKDKVTFSMSGRAGSKGTLELGGWLDPATMALDIDGSMKDLAPLRRQDAKVMLSGTLGVKGTVDSPIVKADITVDKGQVELSKLPGSSIPELEIWTPEKAEAKAQKPA
ncbi:MAG: translocation/assembly module TamB domain-containing protein, partial [Mailhella sp.]|nr:translocation/assembly module TamB domain-containing protein [Mailhella sp.]